MHFGSAASYEKQIEKREHLKDNLTVETSDKIVEGNTKKERWWRCVQEKPNLFEKESRGACARELALFGYGLGAKMTGHSHWCLLTIRLSGSEEPNGLSLGPRGGLLPRCCASMSLSCCWWSRFLIKKILGMLRRCGWARYQRVTFATPFESTRRTLWPHRHKAAQLKIVSSN